MDWHDEGILLYIKSLNDHDAILTLFTKDHGLHRGFYKSSRPSKKGKISIQIGQSLDCRWRARLEAQLGAYTVLNNKPLPLALWHNVFGLNLIGSLCNLLAMTLPEKQLYTSLYTVTQTLLYQSFQHPSPWLWVRDYILWELNLLQQLGFGLELSRCTVSQTTENLSYVSPKTGRAVSRQVGLPYHDKLFILPAFITDPQHQPTQLDVHHGLRLTGYFLENWLLSSFNKKIPFQRTYLALKIAEEANAT